MNSNRDSYIKLGIGIIVVALIGTLIFLGVHTKEMDGKFISKSWTRTIGIEKYDWVHHKHSDSFDYPRIPDGAINIKSWTDTDYSIDEEGNTESDTEYYVSYDVQEWTYSRDISTTGVYPEDPKWPNPRFSNDPPERESCRYQDLKIKLHFNEINKDIEYSSKFEDEYNSFNGKLLYICSVNHYGTICKINGTKNNPSY
jgi:hypothetical protein